MEHINTSKSNVDSPLAPLASAVLPVDDDEGARCASPLLDGLGLKKTAPRLENSRKHKGNNRKNLMDSNYRIESPCMRLVAIVPRC
jgi:hypothetical protein